MNTDTEKFQISFVNLAAALVIVVIAVVVLKVLAPLLQPLFLGIFFFYLGQPLVRKLTQWKIPGIVAHLAQIFVVVAILALFAWMVGAHIDDLAERFPVYKKQFRSLIESGVNWLAAHVPVLEQALGEFNFKKAIPLERLEGIVGAIVGNFVDFLSTSLLVIFFVIFITQEGSTLPARLEFAYGARRSAQILEVGRRINSGIIGYVYVKGMASILVAVLSTIAMVIFQLDLAILWGALVFFGNFIPYVGSAIAVLFPLTICMLQFGSWGAFILLAAILIGCQVLVGNYLEPRFAGTTLNLSPLVVMISLVFWGWLWGIMGLLLSIPIMVSLKFVLENIPATHSLALLMSHAAPKKTPAA